MKGRSTDQLVYEFIFPKPKTSDPQNFQSLLHRHLIVEVRQEVHSFYGHLDTQEAKYPGLDYTHRIHRIRLSRWPWHRKLFRAFDGLRLTHAEIGGLTKWEGTKWAKERFERDSGFTIRDTASDDVGEWVEPEDRAQASRATTRAESADVEEPSADEDMEGEDDSEGELENAIRAMRETLESQLEGGDRADPLVPLDEEWEQWLKNAIDSGELPFLTGNDLQQQTGDAAVPPQALFPPRMLSAARAGRWQEIPEFLHDLLRRTLASETRAGEATTRNSDLPATSTTTSEGRAPWPRDSIFRVDAPHWRRAIAHLRLPAGEVNSSSASEVRIQRTAQPNA
ncbi:hypothetical protein GGR56DRAFT_551120 [Xylariaceae sp. FL0804]|nr:hypothetical protein GGR56DRAFT_551120 [Xylariaceae sp. FL0804]